MNFPGDTGHCIVHTVSIQRLAPLWFVQDKVTPNYVPKSDAKEETSLSLTSKKFEFCFALLTAGAGTSGGKRNFLSEL